MKNRFICIAAVAAMSMSMIACGNTKGAMPAVSLDKNISENGSILDIIACCSTNYNDAQKKLKNANCSFTIDDNCLKSDQPTSFCGYDSNFEIYFIDDIVSECYMDIFF